MFKIKRNDSDLKKYVIDEVLMLLVRVDFNKFIKWEKNLYRKYE